MSRARSIGAFAFVLVSVLLLTMLIALPALASRLAQQTGDAPAWLPDLLSFSERFTQWFLVVFVVAWVFFLGATFASFLNVVAWRVPRGRGILGSSHCPNCDIKLTFKDNIPIVGWLKNGGQCSSCNTSITVRYLLVEIVLGSIFLHIATMVIASGGAILPFRDPEKLSHWHSLIFDPNLDLLQIIVFLWLLMLAMYTFALIEIDWLKIPISVWLTGAVFGIGIAAIWPSVQLVDWHFPLQLQFDDSMLNRYLFVAIHTICGLLTGLLLGWFMDQCKYLSDQPNSFMIGASMVGIFLGWQSALIVACIASSLMLISPGARSANSVTRNLMRSPHANMSAATLIHLITWRWMNFV